MIIMKNVFFLILAILIISCTRPSGEGEEGVSPDGEQAPEAPEEKLFAVIVTPVQRGAMVEYMELSGDVQAISNVDVVAETSGEITRIFVDVGDRVARNELLLRIDPSRPGQNFSSNDVTAPIEGTVIALPLKVGSQTNPGVPVARVSETNELEIITSIAERFVSRVGVGQSATVTLDAYPGQVFAARVSSTSPVLDQSSRTMELTLRVEDPENQLRVGMFASLQLILEKREGVRQLPSDAIIRRFGREQVYIISEDQTQVEERVVVTGLQIDEKIEILEGVSLGELVVYQGQTFLTDGAKIQVIDTVSPIIFAE